MQSYLLMIRYIVSLQVQNGIRNVRLSYQGTKNVAIYALSSGKFLYVRKYACVKDLTNIMSGSVPDYDFCILFLKHTEMATH